jgi:hypothetical protein
MGARGFLRNHQHQPHSGTADVNFRRCNMQLQFIDHGSLGPVERKRIRSHVMKGKNAGRPRPSRKRQPVRQRVQCPDVHDTAPVHPEDWCEVQEYTRTLALKPLLWDDFALTSFPQPLSSRSRALLHKCRQALLYPKRDLCSYPIAFLRTRVLLY